MSSKPTAQGTLGKTPFGHLLLYAYDRRLTGTLAIWPEQNASGGRGQDRLFLQAGSVVAVRTLASHASAYDAVVSLFARRDGPYGFYEDQNLLGSSDDVLYGAVDTYTALSRGMRLHVREEVVEGVLSRIGARAVRVRDGLPIERLELTPAERVFTEQLQKSGAAIDELLRDTTLAQHEVRWLLYLLTLIRGIETAEGRTALSGLTMETMPPASPERPAPSQPTPAAPRSDPVQSTGGRAFGTGTGSVRIPKPASEGRASSSAGTGTMQLPAPPAPPGLSHQDAARWNELATSFDRLDELTHYQLLGVATNASKTEVNTAYFSQVKKYHPDRLPAALAPLARCAHKLFERLTEGNDTLSNPEARAEYDRAVADGGGTRAAERMMRNVLDSTLEFQKAEVLIKRRDFAQAMQHVRSALSKSPDEPDYHALYGWLLHLMNPSDPAPTDEMLASFDRALKANPNSERTHYYKGIVLKRLKRDHEALQHFRAAVQINPRNVEAAREVRLAGMRRDSKLPPGPGGLLSKLFKGPKEGP